MDLTPPRRRMFATNIFVTSACSVQSVTSRLRRITSWHMFVTGNVSFNAYACYEVHFVAKFIWSRTYVPKSSRHEVTFSPKDSDRPFSTGHFFDGHFKPITLLRTQPMINIDWTFTVKALPWLHRPLSIIYRPYWATDDSLAISRSNKVKQRPLWLLDRSLLYVAVTIFYSSRRSFHIIWSLWRQFQ